MSSQTESEFSDLSYAYIIGIGRSGTTLLASILNKHRNCIVSPEIEFVIFFKQHFSGKPILSKEDFRLVCDFFDAFKRKHPMLGLVMDIEKLYAELRTSGITDYKTLIKFLHLRFNFFNKPLKDIKLIVEKNMSHTLFADELMAFEPKARFIFMIRDYRANILSRKQSIEYRSPNTYYNCYRWIIFNKKAIRFMKKCKERVLLLSYEELVTSTGPCIKKVCDHLHLSSQDADMNLYEGDDSSLSLHLPEIKKMNERYAKTFSDIEKPVFKDRIEKWKSELSNADIEIAEVLCGNLGEALGYKRSISVSSAKRAIIKLQSLPFLFMALYDINKEYLLYYISPKVKISRINRIRYENKLK